MKNHIISIKSYWLPAFFCFALYACGGDNNADPQTEATKNGPENAVGLTEAQFKTAGIKTGKIERKAVSSLLKLNGKIDVPPQNKISVSAAMGGYLKSTSLLPGSHVRKGENIAVLEDLQYIQLQQDFLLAKARFGAIEKEFARQKDLNQSKAGSDKALEIAQSEFLSQKIQIKSLSEKLKLIGINPDKLDENNLSRGISLLSPIDGFVTAVNMNIGKYAAPTDVIFELVNPEDIHLELTVFEKDLDKLFIGQKIIAYNNNQTDKKYECSIVLIGKDVSPERAVTVHCHFERYDKSLIPGMFMNAEAETATAKAFAIPNDAVVLFEGKKYVFTETEAKKYIMREVIAQNSENGFTQIAFADKSEMEGLVFVTEGAYTLLMKLKNAEE